MNFVIFFFPFFFLLGYIRKFTARKHNESERLCVKFHDSFAMFGKNSSYSREVVLRVVLQFVEERKRSFVNDRRRIFCNVRYFDVRRGGMKIYERACMEEIRTKVRVS